MKKTNKLLILFVVLSLLVSLVSLPVFAGSGTQSMLVVSENVEKGAKNHKYDFDLGVSYDQVVHGTIKVEGNKGVIGNIRCFESVAGWTISYKFDDLQSGEAEFYAYYAPSDKNIGKEAEDLGMYLWVDVLNSAKIGSQCSITITYDVYGADSDEPVDLFQTKISWNLTVINPVLTVDYSELKAQLERAEAYEGKEKYYPSAAWASFQTALAEAKVAAGVKDQDFVDNAAANLKNAIDALGDAFNYGALEDIIGMIINSEFDFDVNGTLKPAWDRFIAALTAGNEILVNGAESQKEIDDAAKAIKDTFDALMNAAKELEDATTGTSVSVSVSVSESVSVSVSVSESVSVSVSEVTTEVIKEVPGEADGGTHWLILFIVFAILSLILAILLIVGMVKKNKNQNSEEGIDTPNVNEDDEAEEAEAAEEAMEEEASEDEEETN